MFKQRYLVFKYQWISLILGQRSARGPVWRAGDRPLPGWWKQPSCLMLLLLTTLLRVKVNMKARGVSQIFALWLILMYIHVYPNFQVYPELVPTGHKWTSGKISKSNTGTGAGFFTTISEPLNGAQAFLFFFFLFFIFITNIKPQCWGRKDILSKHPMEVSLFTILVPD